MALEGWRKCWCCFAGLQCALFDPCGWYPGAPEQLKLNTDITFLHVDVWLSHGRGDMKLYWSVG